MQNLNIYHHIGLVIKERFHIISITMYSDYRQSKVSLEKIHMNQLDIPQTTEEI